MSERTVWTDKVAIRPPEDDLLERPERPYLPPVLFCLAGCIGAARVVLERGWEPPLGALAAALLALAACFVLPLRAHLASGRDGHRADVRQAGLWRRRALALAAGCLLGMLLAHTSWAGQQTRCARLREAGVASCTWELTADPRATRTGWSCDVRARDGTCAGARLVLSWHEADAPGRLRKGQLVRVNGAYQPAQDDDWGRSLRLRCVCGSLRATRVRCVGALDGPLGWLLAARARAAEHLDAYEPGPRALLAGCVLGLRQGLATDGTRDLFARCGLSHLLAVSGAHLVIVTSLLARAWERTRLSRGARHLALLCSSAVFVLFSGMAASAVRAWLMALVAEGADAAGRRGHGLSSVALAALALLAADCGVVGDLGYLLSVCCVVGLALFGRYLGYVIEALVTRGRTHALLRGTRGIRIRKRLRTLRDGLAASAVCQAVSCPLTLPSFGMLSLVAPVANLLVAPLVGVIVSVGVVVCAVAAFVEPPAWALAPCDLLCAAVLCLVGTLARLPWSSLALEADALACAVPVVVGGGLLLALWPRVNVRLLRSVIACACAFVAVWALRARFCAPARVCVLDVGQGDAILVQQGSHALLVDCGPADGAVAAALTRQGVLHLDAVVVTHQHDDHYGGLASLAAWRPNCVYVAAGVAGHLVPELADAVRACGAQRLQELSCGDVLHAGGYALRVLWPRAPTDGTANPDSLVFGLAHQEGGFTGLLTGDAEQDVLEALLSGGQLGPVDFLKLGHHGSAASLTQAQARTLRPSVAVASAGAHNSYGHPDPACVQALEAVGARFLCTKDCGDVTLYARGGLAPGTSPPRSTTI